MQKHIQHLWPTPVLHINLLDQNTVPTSLHDWLDRYAEDNEEALKGKLENFTSHSKLYTRYDLSVFDSPRTQQLKDIKQIISGVSDEFVRQTIVDPIPNHTKRALMWFVLQHPNNQDDAVSPHYHEGSDVAFAYYLSVPNNESGKLVFLDPRGPINRGGLCLPRHRVFIEISPRRGDLIMFPRYLVHFSTLNTDGHNRKLIGGSIAYDRAE